MTLIPETPIVPIGPKWTVFATRREATPVFNELARMEWYQVRGGGQVGAVVAPGTDFYSLRRQGWRIDVVWDDTEQAAAAAPGQADMPPANSDDMAVAPAGHAGYWEDPTGFVIYALCQGDRVVIKRFLVSERSRRRGMGTALIHAAIKFAIDYKAREVCCAVPKSNLPACQLLRSCGFRVPPTQEARPDFQFVRTLSLRVPGDC